MPPRVVPSEDTSQAMILGEMRGQLREVVHSVNNLSTKLDSLTREVIALGPLAADILDLKTRVKTLELSDSRETGARGLAVWFLQSPIFAWIAAAAVMALAWWKRP